MLLQFNDRAVPAGPDVSLKGFRREPLSMEDLRMDTDNENLLIVRTVEDSDTSALRKTHGRSPEEIMVEILCARVFETEDLTSLRVHAGHDMLDRAVFPGGIHGLKYQQHGVPVVRIEQTLQGAQLLRVLLQEPLIVIFGFEVTLHRRRQFVKPDFLAWMNSEIVRMNLHRVAIA